MINKGIDRPGTQAVAVVTGSALSGAMLALSLVAIPVFLDTTTEPPQMLHQWVRTYHYGHRIFPFMAVATCVLYAHATASRKSAQRSRTLLALAAIVTLAMVPFTWIFMVPTNNTLFRLEEASKLASVVTLDESRELLKHWSALHLLRCLFPLSGAVLGMLGGF